MTDFDKQLEDGVRAYERGDYPSARQRFEIILQVKPYASEIHKNLGNVHFKLNETEQAERCFRKAIELDPLESHAYLNLGNLCFKQERLEEAVHYWEIFKTLDLLHANIWLNLGIAYDKLGDVEKALTSYSGFIARSPDAPETPKIQQRFDQAKKVFEHNVHIAEGLLKKGQKKQAQEILGKALKAYPGSATIDKTYASLLYQDGQFNEALTYYLKAHTKKADDASVLVNLGVLYEKLNQPIGAMWAYASALETQAPDASKITERFSNLLALHQSKFMESLEQGQSWFRQGQLKKAEARFMHLCALSGYFQDGGHEAQVWLQKVQDSLNPGQGAAKIYLARAQDAETGGKFDHALNFYNKLIALQQNNPETQLARQRIAHIKAVMAAAIRSFLS